jgi:sec-independent protein translocase protein TatB
VFDVSFFELLVIGVVALIVIGPERLPGTVRTCALWIGRIKRSLMETRRELEKHIGADEIRRELHNEQVLYNLEKMKDTRQELEERIRKITTGEFLNEGSSSTTSDPAASDTTPAVEPPVSSSSPADVASTPVSEQEAAPQPPADNPPKH